MNVRLLNSKDESSIKKYLSLNKAECMFICNNISVSGIDYKGADFQGEYFGYFDIDKKLLGVIVHYWNGNIMMHAYNNTVLEQLANYLKIYIKRPISGILGPNIQANYVIQNFNLSKLDFTVDRNESLCRIDLENLHEIHIENNMDIVPAKAVPKNILIEWIKNYKIEALYASNDENLEKQVEEDIDRRLQKDDSWVLLSDKIPVSLSAFNARALDIVQVGPVWTSPKYRKKGYARLLLSYILYKEKLNKTKQAILFTDNQAAIRVYESIGFVKIGNYRLSLLKEPYLLAEL